MEIEITNVKKATSELNVVDNRISAGTRYKRKTLEAHQAGDTTREEFNALMDEAHTLMRKLETRRRELRKYLGIK